MKKSVAIIQLLRLPFLLVTIGAVSVGTALAWHQTGRFQLGLFLLALLGAGFFHLACNVANDYFDFRSGNDAANPHGTSPFSGGSRMILEGYIRPKEALVISLFFAFLGSAIGLYLNYVSKGQVILFIGLAALFLIYNYNGFPIRLVNLGVGEVAIFLAWGPLMVLGAYYVQSQSLSFWPLIAGIPPGLLTTLVLLINEFADKEADQVAGRKTCVILFGYEKSLRIYMGLALLCYAAVLAGILFRGWSLWTLLVFLTLPLPFLAYQVGKRNLGRWMQFLAAVKMTILFNFVFSLVLTLTLLA